MATPIGNLGDVTHRALETLRGVDWVAAEDTRVTRGLLAHFGISVPVVALHAHNEAQAAGKVVAALGEGRSVALVTDAGTPGISDPGARVVEAARAAGHAVVPIPGASALSTALSASGMSAPATVFAGFLPAKGSERKQKLAALAATPWAIVLFEAPHRIIDTLADLHAALGDRDVVVARELTKRFETITRLPLADAAAWAAADPDRQRGEFVLVLDAKPPAAPAADDPRRLLSILLEELPLKQAVALAVKITGQRRNELYEIALALKSGK